MKTQNMKLLDLQTGKYLELGKDWVYGGEHIIVSKCNIGYEVYEAIQHNNSEKLYAYDNDCLITEELNEQLKTLCDKTGAVVYGDRYVLSSGKSTQIVERYRFNTTGHRVLREYCLNYIKDTVIYITPESDLIEDVIISTKILKTYELDRNYDANAEIRQGEDKRWYNYLGERTIENVNETAKEIVISSLFEEYSKQLRNEENKFEELMEKLK